MKHFFRWMQQTAELNPPKLFSVVIEGEDQHGNEVDLPLTVPVESINHITYVLALNGLPHRVEPLE